MSHNDEDSYDPSYYNNFSKTVGKLQIETPHISKGKRLFVWTYSLSKQFNVEIEIYIRHTQAKGVTFVAISKHFPTPKNEIEHSDLEKLRSTVFKVLELHVASISGMQWEDWLEITVLGYKKVFSEKEYHGSGAELEIKIKHLKRGEKDGKFYAINDSHSPYMVEFPEPIKLGQMIENERHVYRKDEPAMIPANFERSYIRDTVENRAAISSIYDKMMLLKQALAGLVTQDTVAEKLASINDVLMIKGQ